jgi:dTDP-4-amino-4,6-dideoxygalactose transaminase
MTNLPFFPPDLFEVDREDLLRICREVGLTPDQRFILGERTRRLEEVLADATGSRHVIACHSGTGAVELSVRALGYGPGDEIIVPAFACQPLASSVVNVGATPIFADIDPWTMVIDPAQVEALVTERTKTIIPAHTFSIMADMPSLNKIASRCGLTVIEDAAVAQGARLDERPAGRWGDIGMFSFFQVKAFGTAGEGGVILTDDDDLADTCRMLRNHGQDGIHRFVSHRIGQNSRFDEVIAAFQLHRLPGFEERLERRARIADYYTERFAPLADRGLLAPPPGRNGRCYYVYSLLAEDRERLRQHLRERGIGTHVYYPVPLPLQPAFAEFAPAGQRWPMAERAGLRNLAIPIWPHLTDNDVEYIADSVCELFEERS